MKQHDTQVKIEENPLKRRLALDTLREFGVVRLRALGLSMIPAVWPGDVLVFERCTAAELVTGDIALYERQGRLVAHRVVGISDSAEGLRTAMRGDALSEADPPVAAAQVLGKLKQMVRGQRILAPRTDSTLTAKLATTIARRSGLATRLLAHLHLARGKSRAWKVLWETRQRL